MSDPDVFLAHDDAVQVPFFITFFLLFSVSLFFLYCTDRSIKLATTQTK